MSIIRDFQEHQIRCGIHHDHHWICLTVHELCQQECPCIVYVTNGSFLVDIHQRAVLPDSCRCIRTGNKSTITAWKQFCNHSCFSLQTFSSATRQESRYERDLIRWSDLSRLIYPLENIGRFTHSQKVCVL